MLREKICEEVEILKSTIERREPIIVGFFKLPNLELRIYTSVSSASFAMRKSSMKWRRIRPLCIKHQQRRNGMIVYYLRRKRSGHKDCRDVLIAAAKKNFSPRTCCAVHKKHEKQEP